MKSKLVTLFLIFIYLPIQAQLYFPPNNSSEWETINPSTLNWCPEKIDRLYQFLEINDTKAFILLKDGKIVLEQYFDDHTSDTPWYWASAGKSLTAFLIGIAQQEGVLSIQDKSSNYLGEGWTDCTPEQEELITIQNQLTMTTGLDDGVPDVNCTVDSCFIYLTDAGNRWAYHNGPYTALGGVIEGSTGMSLNQYMNQKVESITGMTGAYFPVGYNNLFLSTARSMARFGLLVLNEGNWNGTPILSDEIFFEEMTTTSQEFNQSYGYLWWLNGQDSYILPGNQLVIPGSINPNGPDDLIMAIGKNGQFINVAPSQNLVMIRMGDYPGNSLVPTLFNDEIWERINDLTCTPVAVEPLLSPNQLRCYPNPVLDILNIEIPNSVGLEASQLSVFDFRGNQLLQLEPNQHLIKLDMSGFPQGAYFIKMQIGEKLVTKKIIRW